MIRFENLTKGFWVGRTYKTVIDNLNLTLPSGQSMALLGKNGAGKSTLLQMIAGTLRADHGKIVSNGSISWPIAFGGSLHGELTGAQNVRFVARLYGVDTDDLVDFVDDFAELGAHFHMPVRTYSSGMRSRLTFGTSMGIHFDTYLVDEITAVGDHIFRSKSKAVFRERMKKSGAILVSHDMKDIRDFCDVGLVLDRGRIEFFDDLEAAIRRHRQIG